MYGADDDDVHGIGLDVKSYIWHMGTSLRGCPFWISILAGVDNPSNARVPDIVYNGFVYCWRRDSACGYHHKTV